MNELTVVDRATEWRRMKSLVLDSVSSPITKRVYNMALDEFFGWYAQEPRPGFTKATVSAWRVSLEERGLGSSSIIVRMSAIRKLAVEATDNGLLAPELAAGIQRVKSAKSIGVRAGNWLSLKQAQALLNAPDITTTKGLRDRAIIAVLLYALCRSAAAALTDGRSSGGFPPEATVAAPRANTLARMMAPGNCANSRWRPKLWNAGWPSWFRRQSSAGWVGC
jgi:hypothetical protein